MFKVDGYRTILKCLLAVCMGGGLVVPLTKDVFRNLESLKLYKKEISPELSWQFQDLDNACKQARREYALGQDQLVVDLLYDRWLQASDIVLRGATCWGAAYELATSLAKLNRSQDQVLVLRRLIGVNPGSRDWVMHFAQLSVGNAEMEAGNWQAAMESFVIAYDSALPVPADVEVRYEERAWQHFERLADALIAADKLQTALEQAKVRVAGDSPDPGWAVLAGILLERISLCDEALAYYRPAYQQAPTAQFLKEHILDLEVGKAACQH